MTIHSEFRIKLASNSGDVEAPTAPLPSDAPQDRMLPETEENGGLVPPKISGLKFALFWPYLACLMMCASLAFKIGYFGLGNMDWIFIFPFAASFGILILSGMTNKKSDRGNTKLSVPKCLAMTFYIGSFPRPFSKYREAKLVSHCYADRTVCSARDFGIAIVTACILISGKTSPDSPGFQICSGEDVVTGVIVFLGLLAPCVAAVLYEIQYHQASARADGGYSRPFRGEKYWLFIIQFSRLLWTLHFLTSVHLLYPWIAGPIWLPIVFFTFNIIVHNSFESCLIFFPEHFLFPTPTTLACSLTDLEGKLFVIVFKDLLPMIGGQAVMFYLSKSSENPVVRGEIPYFCRVEDGPFSPLEVPLPFSKNDWVGFIILGIYAVFLIAYWAFAQRRLERKEQVVSDSITERKKKKKKEQ